MRHAGLGLENGTRSPVAERIVAFGRRAFVVGAGYCVAVAAATVVTVAHMVWPSVLPDNGALGSFYSYARDWPMLLFGGMMMTFPAALPGFLLVVALAARGGWQGALRFTLAGGLNAFPALLLGGGGFGAGSLLAEPFFTFCCFGGGLAGGFGYWVVAESWRQEGSAWRELRFS